VESMLETGSPGSVQICEGNAALGSQSTKGWVVSVP
jgi:hypothetical protein